MFSFPIEIEMNETCYDSFALDASRTLSPFIEPTGQTTEKRYDKSDLDFSIEDFRCSKKAVFFAETYCYQQIWFKQQTSG